MLRGIPAILMYRMGNITFVPDEMVNGSNSIDIDALFMKRESKRERERVRERETGGQRKRLTERV